MSDFQQARAYDFVTLVDRTGLGGCEIIHDGFRVVFKRGQTERPVPQFLAEWLSRVDQQKVHTTDGEFVQRFGVKDPSEEFLRTVGDMDCSPITVDKNRLEGWDVDQYAIDRDPAKTRVIELRRNPADFANVATPGSTFGNER